MGEVARGGVGETARGGIGETVRGGPGDTARCIVEGCIGEASRGMGDTSREDGREDEILPW